MQRTWWPDPVYNPLSSNITCNWNGAAGAFHAPISAGDNITAHWDNDFLWDDPTAGLRTENTGIFYCDPKSYTNITECPYRQWYHFQGPILAYLADCDGDCTTVDPSALKWFKIAESTLKPGHALIDSAGWDQEPLTWSTNNPGWTITIPENLKSGRYLIRHEILYILNKPTQIFPYCAQIEVSGKGTESPDEEYLVKFPGAYKLSGM